MQFIKNVISSTMHISISGHTGFIGQALSKSLTDAGHQVTGIGRKDLERGAAHLATIMEGSDFVVNLAGAPIIRRWTRSYSRELWSSRIETTRKIREAIASLHKKPIALISASAVGYYAPEGKHTEENNEKDPEFLGTLCSNWEEEALKAQILCPVKIIRIGIVLGKNGGALPQMARPFRMGVGGKIGDGKQVISWIHLDDLLSALQWIMAAPRQSQVFNLTAPAPVSNAHFSKVLAGILKRPSMFTVPPFALRLLYGEGAVALLSGQHAEPANLLKEGFRFRYHTVEEALTDLLAEKQ